MNNMGHSPLGPSQAKRYINCPGSIRLCASLPPEAATQYAAEGTAAHKLAEYFLNNAIYEPNTDTDWSSYLPEKYRRYYSQEMIEHVRVYTEYIQQQLQLGEISAVHIELTYNLDWLCPGIWGTCDCVIVRSNGIIKVIDFKYGAGTLVEVKDNQQLMIYGLMAGKNPLSYSYRTDLIDFTIVQPRAFHPEGPIRHWSAVSYKEILKWGKRTLKVAVAKTRNPKALLECGDWCKFCQANCICPEKKQEIMEVTQVEFASDKKRTILLPDVKSLTLEQAVQVYQLSQSITVWTKSVASYLKGRLEKGEKNNLVKLVRGRGTRNWFDENRVKDMAKLLGVEVYTEPKLKSPAQVEKVVKKNKANAIAFEKLWTKEPGGLSLAPVDDPREAVNVEAITDSFLEDIDIFQ